ncbi:MAG: ABC transporter permease [Candidatus Latescibacterota bacterium]|nr:ABC transporter permease [Candidatus Latescibacterota bacterium]
MIEIRTEGDTIFITGPLVLNNVSSVDERVNGYLSENSKESWNFDLAGLTKLDTAGAVFLHSLNNTFPLADKLITEHLPTHLQPFFKSAMPPAHDTTEQVQLSLIETLDAKLIKTYRSTKQFFLLLSDLSYFAITSIGKKNAIRRDAFLDQSYMIGAQALPIIGMVIFLIGAVSALQSAAQLRQFGADIFVADLLAIGITRELGPLMTAIMVAGRSGSAIAAEIATMKFSEELDALQTMALDPLRFVAIPKLWAMIVTVPLLTILADTVGIAGGVFIGITTLDISPAAFIQQVSGSLFLRDVLSGIIKSFFFAWIITVIAVFKGLQFSGGAVGVGRAITGSVVSSLVGIIVLDLIFNLLVY